MFGIDFRLLASASPRTELNFHNLSCNSISPPKLQTTQLVVHIGGTALQGAGELGTPWLPTKVLQPFEQLYDVEVDVRIRNVETFLGHSAVITSITSLA